MLKCKQVIDLASNSLETSLPLTTRWQFKLHLLMCKTCQRYLKQLQFMQKAAASINDHCQAIILSDAARKRIRDKLKDR
ncbi:MAG: anti-sigma factor family protein [Gammaproteobacteria bacterium]